MKREEQLIHKTVASHLRQRGVAGLLWWHTPSGVFMGKNRRAAAVQGGIMKSLGWRAGVSDIVALHNGKFFALELKSHGGRPTEAQLAFVSDVNAAGGYAVVAEGLDEALKCLEFWGLVRGKTT